ncbi:small VCP/p97-interacting protein isoform X2 [Pseudochaenichthys georgianus]|uniref:small VCP/p97-interacting protein isoform X2 n=1 Tax=Pseudochaenichthys georgianus TaxID=52239 RepID=UPI0039C00CA0
MGMCLPCLGGAADDVVVTPDPDARRRQLAEAAEKRQKEKCHLKTRKSHAKVVSRQHTGGLKIQKQSREKRRNRKRWKNRR